MIKSLKNTWPSRALATQILRPWALTVPNNMRRPGTVEVDLHFVSFWGMVKRTCSGNAFGGVMKMIRFFDRFCIDTWKAKESVGIERVEGFDRVAMAWFSMGAFFFWQGLSLPEQSTHDLEHLHFPLLVAQGYTQSEWLFFKTSSRKLAGMLASQTSHLLNWYTP